jgi:hypothetical protein
VTIDWFVLLTPIVLLVVALPFLFVGCARFDAAPGVGTVAGPPLGVTPLTAFRLEMDANLQLQLPSPVVKIEVTWSLESATGVPAPIILPQPPPAVIRSTQVPPSATHAIDPLKDPGASASIESANVGTRDQVRCICTVFLANGTTGDVAGTSNAAVLKKDGTHEFRIQSRAQTGRFRVYFNGA